MDTNGQGGWGRVTMAPFCTSSDCLPSYILTFFPASFTGTLPERCSPPWTRARAGISMARVNPNPRAPNLGLSIHLPTSSSFLQRRCQKGVPAHGLKRPGRASLRLHFARRARSELGSTYLLTCLRLFSVGWNTTTTTTTTTAPTTTSRALHMHALL